MEPVPTIPRPLRSHRTRKTAMWVAQQIVEEIAEHGCTAGMRLPPEKEMLEIYDVGRGTLRESLRFLEMQGILSIRPGPGGGPVVNAVDPHDLASTLALFLQLLNAPFGAIAEGRAVLEPAMAARAAERIPPEKLEELRASVDRMEAAIHDEGAFLVENEKFHELVAWASGNKFFGVLLSSLHWITDGTAVGVGYPEKRRRAVLRAHRTILDAIAVGDSDAAYRAMELHVGEFTKYVAKFYPGVWDRPLRWSQIVG